ncbi:nitrate- and nitrite sensing domain-containing protein [Streptomyces sp. NPDC006798]|uniref:sensor histidine kinase n=1 Tax=Streptomyces sp. NPDC006798 TaxID=3155462 RepID=UPI0033E983E2
MDTGSRLALRNWRISTRLISLLTLPVVAATTLGGLRINESLDKMEQLEHMQLLTDMTEEATKLAIALQYERDVTAGPLANNSNASDFKVTEPRQATDRARTAFVKAAEGIDIVDGDDTVDSFRSTLGQIYNQLNRLKEYRSKAYVTEGSNALTVESYHRIIRSLLELSSDMAQATNNQDMIKRTRALAAFSAAKEYASIQQAVIAAALPGGAGQKGDGLSEADRLYGQGALESGRNSEKQFKEIYESLGGDANELMEPLDRGHPDIIKVNEVAGRALDNPNALKSMTKQSHLDWTDAYSVRIDAMKRIESSLLDDMEEKARQLRDESQQDAIINGVVIFLVLGVSLVGAFIVARSMIRSLRRLQDTATKVAQERLPELVKQLSEADPEDVDTSVESVGVHSRDEIGKVAAAFDEVHREAVRLAAEQALLRGNVNAMFTNLSRRSQGLIQRQLSLISELESREADPDQLSSLFKLDHLATRMRRNGENLLVLAGEEPGRRWTRPVPLVDVLRAAASEVEQYERIELAAVPATDVAGRVVNDLVHLLAELLENATSFSSPQTKVRVTGHALPDGRVLIEIHDTGIGLSPEDLAAINERLASPPTVDVSVSRRMGLFVVGRLSLRHGIRIQLRPSDSGGTTALVMLPVDVAQGGRKPGAPGAPGASTPPSGGAPLGPGQSPGGNGGNGGRPGGGQGAPSGGGLLGAGAPRGQVGAGAAGSRAALPSRDGAPGRPQGGGLAGAFGNRPAQRSQGPDQNHGRGAGPGDTAALPRLGADGRPAGNRGELPDPGRARPQTTSWGSDQRPGGHQDPGPGQQDRQYGAPTAERPQGPAGGPPGGSHQGGTDPGIHEFDAPMGQHRPPNAPTGQFVRPDVFGAPADGSGRPAAPDHSVPSGSPAGSGSSAGSLFGTPAPDGHGHRPGPDHSGQAAHGQFAPPRGDAGGVHHVGEPRFDDPPGQSSAGQFARPGTGAPQPPAPGLAPAPHGYDERRSEETAAPGARNELPPQPRHEALPPAPGDGGTPLYDTLETDWFRGQERGGRDEQRPAEAYAPEQVQQTQPIPQIDRSGPRPGPEPDGHDGRSGVHDGRSGYDRVGPGGTGEFSAPTSAPAQAPRRQEPQAAPGDGAGAAWRTSPNDELGRQAERVRKPAAGGVTTSGLPRRVPRANLVAGTAQQNGTQGGPSVSRAPDDVRGRLTNLRRGIQQGREQNGSSTGSIHLGPTHQQER